MNKFKFALLVGFFFAFSITADAQATRTWVSGVGDDINPCSRTAPCKTFTGALQKTALGGEINCLDPGGYGTVTITKSITIDCEDFQPSILAGAGAGITVNVTDPNDTAKTVRLRGLEIVGIGTGVNGIRVTNANKLVVEDVVIDGFAAHGISIDNSGAQVFNLVVKKTTIRNNAINGINTALANGAAANIFVIDSLFVANAVGFNQNGSTKSVVADSTFTGNGIGLQANGSTSILAVKSCRISHGTTGINALASATIRIGGNMITANGTGLSGTNIFTWGDNLIDGNTPVGNGTNNGNASSQ